jgi:hypothetical protein
LCEKKQATGDRRPELETETGFAGLPGIPGSAHLRGLLIVRGVRWAGAWRVRVAELAGADAGARG